ncbi:MAG: succinylglutamate desuccinylase/aspartoacylase family protein, partial [Halodesulfurarchaeum sp.]
MTPGELTRETETRYLAKLPSGVVIETPVHRYRGEKDGPTVYVQALQHGGEVIGAVVLRRIHDRLLGTSLAGTVISVPVANPLAVDHRRYLAPSRVDAVNSNMNRQWPGDENGTIFQRMVDRLWTLAGEADVIIDLHTGGPDMLSHVRFTPGHSQSRELATAFGLDLVVGEGSPDSSGESDGGGGKLREVAAENDIPCITPELTHSRAVVEDSVESGVDGVMNVL